MTLSLKVSWCNSHWLNGSLEGTECAIIPSRISRTIIETRIVSAMKIDREFKKKNKLGKIKRFRYYGYKKMA